VARDKNNAVLTKIPISRVDIWLSSPAIPSTIGAPTPENVSELLELVLQLRLLSPSRNSWTSAGQLANAFREKSLSIIADPKNPFLLGMEALPLFRQLIEVDGFILRELLRILPDGGTVSRDYMAGELVGIVRNAVKEVRRFSPHVDYETIKFQRLIESTAKKRARQSRAPGGLEHRITPRMEWLVDLGYLSKDGLPKNGFDYQVLPAAKVLLNDLDLWVGDDYWAESVIVSQSRSNPYWSRLKSAFCVGESKNLFPRAYRMLKRSIGPSSLKDVAFIAAILSCGEKTFQQTLEELIRFGQHTKGVELSRARYRRSPENIFMADELLKDL
jgi:hypothetical protein